MSDIDQRTTTWDDKKQRIYLRICDYETKEFSGLTTYHGLVRIYNSNTWPSRIFWCVVVLSCLFLFMIHSGFLLLNYHSKPTLFQVNVIVPEEGIVFPDITICNNNPVLAGKLEAWAMPPRVLDYVLKVYSKDLDEDLHVLKREHQEFLKYEKALNSSGKAFSFMDFFASVGADCESLVEWCSFGGVPLDKCCEQTRPILTDSGLCIRFPNFEAKNRQWFSGWAHGWQIMLNVDDSSPDDDTSFLPDEFADQGVRVAVHEANEFPSMRAHSISVPPGTTLYAGMDVRNVTLLSRLDWGLCQPNWDPAIHGDLVVPFEYSARHCEANCLIKRYMDVCKCVPLSVTLADQFPICSPLQLASCRPVMEKNNSKPCFCDVKCEQLQYDLKTSYGNLRASEARGSTNDSGKSRILVNVYMREISYERHEQQKQMQTADLLSNIAGSMGLFLGMSTVTLLEIFIYLFKSVWGTINSDRQKQFVEAMIMEENELQDEQRVIVVEEEPNENQQMSSDQAPLLTDRKLSRRISILPYSVYNSAHNHNSTGLKRTSNAQEIAHDEEKPRRSISVFASSPYGPRRFSIMSTGGKRRASHQDSVVKDTLGIPSLSVDEPSPYQHRLSLVHTRRHSAVPHKRPSSFLDF